MTNPRSQSRVKQLRAFCYQRDGGICYRCAKPIDPRLDGNHPQGCTLEHLLPPGAILNDHPDAAYDPARTTIAHRVCNTTAGAHTGNQRQRTGRPTPNTWTL